MPASSTLQHFFKSNLLSNLHPTTAAAKPEEVISGHPRASIVFSLEHLRRDENDVLVMSRQYAIFIISRSGQPWMIDNRPKSVTPAHLRRKKDKKIKSVQVQVP